MINLPKLIGHRGVKDLSPENTLNSIALAKECGLNWVEIDVKISKDLIPILLHDDTLDRTANINALPIDFQYHQIKNFDVGKFFYNIPTKIYIPTLQEVLIYCNQNKLNLNIELKPNLGFEKKNVQAIINTINKSNYKNSHFFSSFDLASIILMKKSIPNSNCGLLIDEFSENNSLKNILDICKTNNFFCCGFSSKIINSDIIYSLKKNNIITTVYSNKNFTLSEAKSLWQEGVQSIFIDNPSKFTNV